MTEFFVKVESPDFQLPQVVIDNLPPASPDELATAVTEYLDENPVGEPLLEEHVADTTPHPAYDDLPSLSLLFQNGLV